MSTAAPSAKLIFDEAFELDPAERPAFLDRACGGDLEVRKRVEALLRAYDSAGSFLESPALPQTGALQAVTTEQPGTIIGPFKLLQMLGEGGMGEVWMAEQEQPVKRRVALKIIKAGMDSARVIARFEAERQALALMDHPNIAKVIDAGMAGAGQNGGSGRPYFVMELVKGIPLTKYCDENHLTPKERLELFIPICQAVQHAHQKGIIHRDLKPSNVLIALYDGKPVPKVIDFGVAKALHQNLTERTMFTEIGSIIGTLEYMSPEQAELNNLDIDTRSDIYSLGVILYELLTGSRPLDAQRLRSAAFADMLRIIREEEPEKPSTKLSHSGDRLPSISAQRKTEPRKLSKLIRGDLDWIVMKALEKDRARRYETANGFAMDVQRYLSEEPVLAGPPGAAYRMRKFVRRNKAQVLAASLVLLALVAGMVGTYWGLLEARRERDRALEAQVEAQMQRQRAEEAKQLADRNFQKARAAVDQYLQKVADDPILTNRADLNALRKQLLSAALPFFEEFVKEKNDDPAIRFSQANAYSRLAVLRRWLGDQEGGLRDVTKAQELFSRLTAEFPDDPKYRCGFAVCLHDSAAFLDALGRQSEADPQVIQAIAILEKLVEQFPEFVPARSHLANSLNSRGSLLSNVGQLEQSLAAFRRAIAVQDKLAADYPSMEHRSSLAMFQRNLGRGLTDQKKPADAELMLHRSIQIQRQLIVEFPLVALHRQYLAASHCALGFALKSQKRAAESEAAFQEAVVILEKLAADFPSIPQYRHELVSYKKSVGIAQEQSGNLSEAERTYRGCAEVGERLVADFPAMPDYRVTLSGTYVNIANFAVKRKDFAAALEGYGKGLALLEGVLAQDSRRAKAREFARNAHIGRATTHRRMSRPGEALFDLEKAIAFDDGSMRSGLGWQHALTLAEAGHHAAAVAEAEKLAGESKGAGNGEYNTACLFALSSAANSSDAKLSEEYAVKAVDLLRLAQAAGLFMDVRQVENMKNDTDLKALWNREDFRKLLAELEANPPPAKP